MPTVRDFQLIGNLYQLINYLLQCIVDKKKGEKKVFRKSETWIFLKIFKDN